jgi:hypothetical protein
MPRPTAVVVQLDRLLRRPAEEPHLVVLIATQADVAA